MKDKFISIIFVTILFIVGFSFLVISDKDTSFYERRKLMSSEKLSDDILENLDDYMSDQFPFRDVFISLNSVFDRYFLMNKEKNDVYIVDDYLVEKNYPLNEQEVNDFVNKINYINSKYLGNSNVFYSVIPDKSYYLDDEYLKLNFDELLDNVKSNLDIEYIDIMDDFVIDDYFKTDIHLKQDSYFKVMNKFDKYLDFGYKSLNYSKKTYKDFYGASVGKVGAYVKGEDLDYYVSDYIDKVKVNHLEYGKNQVYDIEKLEGLDAYSLFLSGPSSLISIDNPNSSSSKELIIFRDSFGSSFAPLLIPFYKKIILIDLRYINMELIPNYVDFDNKDILFLYSTLIINTSNLLKIKVY